MGHRGDDGRVAVVIKPLDHLLNGARFVLIPILALVASLSAARALTGEVEISPGNWMLIALTAVIVVAYAAVMQADRARARIDRSFAQLRRRVALACNHDEARAGDRLRAACRLTPGVFRVPLFKYDEQKLAVSQLVKACDDEGPGRYWFLEGESGSGKTRTAFRVVQALSRDRRLFELGNRCFFYDLGESELVQDELLERLGTLRHDGDVVFVDNFQHVRAKVLSRLTYRLLERGEEQPERLLVFLTRKADAWNLLPRSDVRLLAEAKAEGHYLELDGASANTVTRFVSEFDKSASALVRKLEHEKVATAAQAHMAQVVGRRGEAPAEALAMLRLLDRELECADCPELTKVLAAITALSVHRGAVSRRELSSAMRTAARAGESGSRLRSILRIRLMFWRLRRTGIVPKVQLRGARFLFHEAIAELCVDRLSGDKLFSQPFTAVAEKRIQARRAQGDDLTAWLIAAEIGDEEALVNGFDGALGRGAYGRMARCLRRTSKRVDLSPPARLQLAILLDRIGAFPDSRAIFTDDLVAALSSSDQLAVVLAASRIESGHDRASEVGIEDLCRNPNRQVAIIGEYWKLHIAGHRGDFASPRLLALASELLPLVEKGETHWLTYSLARMHFDSLRQHYLEGRLPPADVESMPRQALDAYLEDRLPTYEALHVLYGQAHMVAHVLLPKLAIFGQAIGVAEAAQVEIGSSDVATTEALVNRGRRLYMRAREEFWQYGDREAEYLQADVLNMEMIGNGADLDAFKSRLDAYQQFIAKTGFAELFSYPHFYFFRWFMLKHYQAPADEAGKGSRIEYLNEAAWNLQRMVELDTAVENRFGLLRAEMLAMLLRAVREPVTPAELASLAGRMAGFGYDAESRLLRHLAARPIISSAELEAVFRFYPFVHQ